MRYKFKFIASFNLAEIQGAFYKIFLFILLIALIIFPEAQPTISRIEYWINPNNGSNSNDGSYAKPFKTIKGALDKLQNGTGATIYLMDGIYDQSIYITQGGSSGNPLRIIGQRNAIICGTYQDSFRGKRIITLSGNLSSYIELYGFTVDGLCNRSNTNKENYYDKLIFVNGDSQNSGPLGIKIIDLAIKNAGAECVRFRFNTNNSEFAYNQVSNCGQYYFPLPDPPGSKNGEGLYIGTSTAQNEGIPDISNNNYVHHNDFDTQGNECVDIKEGSSNNIVEYNTCTGQKDSESGGLDSRGDNNIFRFNHVYMNVGAGVRLGGNNTYGANNIVAYNYLADNYEGINNVGAKKQTAMCGNEIIRSRASRDGLDDCPSTYPRPIAYYGSAGGGSPRPTPVILQTPNSNPTSSPTPIPSATPMSSPTPIPSATSMSSPTPIPSATPTSSPTPIILETPSATPTIDLSLVASVFLPAILVNK